MYFYARAQALRRSFTAVCFVSILIVARFAGLHAHVDPARTIKVQRTLMGTIWNIEVVDQGRPIEAARAINAAYAELARIESLMSEWKPDSPLSQINAAAGKHPVKVPAELRTLIERSKNYGDRSERTFDITWHSMAHIWHFDDAFRPPDPASVEQARRNVDYRKIQVEGDTIFLKNTGMSIGLGGIAKGYAIDRASAILTHAGFNATLVDGGGDVLVTGKRTDEGWHLGIQNPRAERGETLGLVRVTNQAVVTSGDYERFRIVDGVRYHHIIDPRTGYPATASISVTVIADTAEHAVVMCKPIFILGPEKGLAIARAEGVDAMIIDAKGQRYMTDGFRRTFKQQ